MWRNMMKKKIIIGILAFLVVAVAGVFIYANSLLDKINRVELPQNDADLGIVPNPVETNNHHITNIALFGLDARDPNANTRSDVIMVVSIDKDSQKVKVSSLMRDMYVPIPGKEDNRINAAYAIGGPALAVKTLNTNFGLDIRNYVKVDFFGLEKLIDKVGGVNINVKSNEIYYVNLGVDEVAGIEKDGNTKHIEKAGLQLLNGRQAVAYARIRHTGNADYERTDRQRTILNELFKKIKAQGALKLPGIISEMLPFVETSMSKTEILSLGYEAVKFDAQSIEQFRLPVDGLFRSQSIRGMSVLVPDIEKNKEKLHEFVYGPKATVGQTNAQ
jgi:LCP family protein required for cell wall assembly